MQLTKMKKTTKTSLLTLTLLKPTLILINKRASPSQASEKKITKPLATLCSMCKSFEEL